MKIHRAFANGKAFIPFLTCGDPNLETTEKIIYALEQAGSSLIELGIPFSDPTAEGPVIQMASARALQSGTTTDSVLDMIKRIRPKVNVPLVIMTYANVVFSYGIERFFQKAAGAGVQGIILPDVPFEEKEEFASPCEERGLNWIPLIAPTSAQRIEMLAREGQGFIYLVSSLGVTGVRNSIQTDLAPMIQTIHQATSLPVAVGFGIGTPAQACEIARYADGIIVGSAIMELVAKHGEDAPSVIYDYTKEMVEALKGME